MPSTFGWLDTDTQERSGMLDVIDLFRERGTLDELGIGGIRDALSNLTCTGVAGFASCAAWFRWYFGVLVVVVGH